jgi:hypothetical protein
MQPRAIKTDHSSRPKQLFFGCIPYIGRTCAHTKFPSDEGQNSHKQPADTRLLAHGHVGWQFSRWRLPPWPLHLSFAFCRRIIFLECGSSPLPYLFWSFYSTALSAPPNRVDHGERKTVGYTLPPNNNLLESRDRLLGSHVRSFSNALSNCGMLARSDIVNWSKQRP